MKVVFFGSSAFSLPSLHALATASRHSLVGVIAQPDRPSGRNRTIHPGPVHAAALKLGIPVALPEKVGDDTGMTALQGWQPDLIAVASYGQYIPTRVLALPPKRVINVHPSLLPRYRGAAPLQWSVAKGETRTGVTIFYIEKEMDAGPVILQEEHPLHPGDDAETLGQRLAIVGAELLLKAIDRIEDGTAVATPQDPERVTYAPKIEKADGAIMWHMAATELHNRIRGFQPWPGGYFTWRGGMIKVWKSRVEPVTGSRAPGEVVSCDGDGPLIATGEGGLRLLMLQPEGKRRMDGRAFLCGHAWKPGETIMENPL